MRNGAQLLTGWTDAQFGGGGESPAGELDGDDHDHGGCDEDEDC